jgi:hypothetical protein
MEGAKTAVPTSQIADSLDVLTVPDGGSRRSTSEAILYLATAYTKLSKTPFADELMRPADEGFERFLSYVLGLSDGVPKSPHWAARLIGVPSYTIRALARDSATWSRTDFGTESEIAEIISRAKCLDGESCPRPDSRFAGLPHTLVAGTVYDYEADEVIAGALVTIKEELATGGAGTESNRVEVQVVTDELGGFLVDAPERGAYLVSIEKDGYAPGHWGPVKVEDGKNLRDFPMFADWRNAFCW